MNFQKPYLQDMLTAIEKIMEDSDNISFEVFLKNHTVHDSIMYNFIIIGEATKRISEDFKQINNTIEWHKLIGMRNHLAHSYDEINYTVIWETIKVHLPQLKTQIQTIIQNL